MNAIFPIVFIFLMIISVIYIFYFIILKEICKKMSFEKARNCEIKGYFLLFLILVWEFYFKGIECKDFYNINLFNIEEKLNIIFNTILYNEGLNYDLLRRFNSLVPSNFLKIQLFIIDIIEVVLKILSTVFISIGRIHELYSKLDKK